MPHIVAEPSIAWPSIKLGQICISFYKFDPGEISSIYGDPRRASRSCGG